MHEQGRCSAHYAPVKDSLLWDSVNDATSSSSVPMGDLNGLRSLVRNWLVDHWTRKSRGQGVSGCSWRFPSLQRHGDGHLRKVRLLSCVYERVRAVPALGVDSDTLQSRKIPSGVQKTLGLRFDSGLRLSSINCTRIRDPVSTSPLCVHHRRK